MDDPFSKQFLCVGAEQQGGHTTTSMPDLTYTDVRCVDVFRPSPQYY